MLDEAGVAEAILAAGEAGEPLLVRGLGSKLGMLRPVQAARTLSLAELTGITLYAPKELVISARAGTRLADIEAALASSGQHLIAEPPDLSALLGTDAGGQTLGGVIATNLSGPRRIAWGAMRDHIIGVRAVNGRGEIIRSGGRVLKNVTGLDLCKLLTGSHGTLAVMTEITLKVLPAPEASGSIAVEGLDATAGVAALSAALGSPFGVSGAAWLPGEAAARVPGLEPLPTAIVRIEEFAPSVAYRLGRLRDLLAPFGAVRHLPQADSVAAWRAIRDARALAPATGDAVWRVSVRPSAAPALLAALAPLAPAHFLDWGGGLVWLVAEASEAAHQAVRAAALAAGGTWMLMRAPDPLRAAAEVVPPEVAALAGLGARVKEAFDPKGVLNPGRMRA